MIDNVFEIGLAASVVIAVVGTLADRVRKRRQAESHILESDPVLRTEQRAGSTPSLAYLLITSVGAWLPLVVLTSVMIADIQDPVRRWTVVVVLGLIVTTAGTIWALDIRKRRLGD